MKNGPTKISQILETMREGGTVWRQITWRFVNGRVNCHIRVKPHDPEFKVTSNGG